MTSALDNSTNATAVAEKRAKEQRAVPMTDVELDKELATNFFNQTWIHQPASNQEIYDAITGQKLMKTVLKDMDDKEGKKTIPFPQGPNTTHANLVVVYASECNPCHSIKPSVIKLADTVHKAGLNLNILGVNDGNPLYRKELPGGMRVTGYPKMVLYQTGKKAIEFNPSSSKLAEGEDEPPQYEWGFNGFVKFLTKNGIDGLPEVPKDEKKN